MGELLIRNPDPGTTPYRGLAYSKRKTARGRSRPLDDFSVEPGEDPASLRLERTKTTLREPDGTVPAASPRPLLLGGARFSSGVKPGAERRFCRLALWEM